MKNALLFAAIMLVCGSLKKPEQNPCPKVVYTLYWKGGVVNSIFLDKQIVVETQCGSSPCGFRIEYSDTLRTK